MDILDSVKNILLPVIEAEVKKQIEQHSDKIVDELLAKLALAIPGKLDDGIIETVKPQLKAGLKDLLLKQADKIS